MSLQQTKSKNQTLYTTRPPKLPEMDLFGHNSILGLRKSDWIENSPTENDDLVERIFCELRASGFPHFALSKHELGKVVKQLRAFDPKTIINGSVIKQNMTGQNFLNHYMPHIWSVRSRGFLTPMETFLSDQKLRGAIRKRLQLGDNISLAGIRKSLSWTTGTQKVSSFRPTAAKAIYWKLGGNRVLDFSAGFGGRLLGAMSLSSIESYVGIDPSKQTVTGLNLMIYEHSWEKKATIIQAAFEDVELDDKFDLAFSSPPYFNTEEYSNDEDQSFLRYKTPNAWRNGFLRKTIEKCGSLLNPNGILAINVANVKTYPTLEADTVEDAGNSGFVLSDTLQIAFSKLMSSGFKYEPLFVFRKMP